jgi:nitroreductase/NAD-dependent dihydropyrimidine dehydrogenase PreA subunit
MIFEIDQTTCNQCHLCAEICPVKILSKHEDETVYFIPERTMLCIQCGHCMAICSMKSIIAGDLSYEKDFLELPENPVDYERLKNFLQHRRSIRYFKDKPVEKEILQKILDSLSSAPFGIHPQNVQYTIINDQSIIKEAVPFIADSYKGLGKIFPNPVIRWLIKRMIPLETYNTLKNFIIPHIRHGMYIHAAEYDDIARNAPALILFHAHKGAEEHTADSHIYLTYTFLAAHALGLGATVIGLIPPAINRDKKLRALFRIPKNHNVITSLIVGYPKYHFKRAITRPRLNVHWL